MSFPYNSTFWREKKNLSLSRAEIYSRLSDGQSCDDLELLPLEQIAQEASRTFKNTSQHENIVSWIREGALHQILLKPQYFQYGYMPISENWTQGALFEIIDFPQLAGKFGCLMYTQESDTSLEPLIGSTVLESTKLKALGNQAHCDSPPIQLPISQLQGSERIYRAETIAEINKTIEDLESRTGLIFEVDIDCLDALNFAVLEIGTECYFLERHFQAPPGVQVAVTTTSTSPGEALDLLLIAFDMTTNDLSWYHKSVKFTPHELWRQDDNGNQVLIETCICQADALQKARMFTERGHRQLYWAQRVK
jgi:hypothetical protein